MTFDEIIKTANEYADMAIRDRDEFLDAYDNDVKNTERTAAEWYAIGALLDPYIRCKTGELDRNIALLIQRNVRESFGKGVL